MADWTRTLGPVLLAAALCAPRMGYGAARSTPPRGAGSTRPKTDQQGVRGAAAGRVVATALGWKGRHEWVPPSWGLDYSRHDAAGFVRWLDAGARQVPSHLQMNCWEMVLAAGVEGGALSKSRLRAVYAQGQQDAQRAQALFRGRQQPLLEAATKGISGFVRVILRELRYATALPFRIDGQARLLNEGDVLTWGFGKHVAIATGQAHPDGGQEILSLHGQGVASIPAEAVNMSPGAGALRVIPSPWEQLAQSHASHMMLTP